VSGDGGLHGLNAEARDRAHRSPYPGLRPFGDDDAELFSGRDDEALLVIANLRASPLTILYGPSGVGKSSLLHAGVAHRLTAEAVRAQRDGVPAPTVVVHDEWAGDAAAALTRHIQAATGGAPNGSEANGNLGLDATLKRWAAARRGMLLIVFDQFEEYLRLHPAGDGYGFDELFCDLAAYHDLQVHYLLSLRDDALADLDRFEGRIPHLFDNYLRLPQLTPAAARGAIEEPVATVAAWRAEAGLPPVGLEDGLTDDVLAGLAGLPRTSGSGHDAQQPAGDAPVEPAYLQLVMRRLWEVETGEGSLLLRRDTLRRLGGAETIVSGHLDEAMAALTPSQQETAAAVLRFLVTPSGAKIRFTAEDLADYAERPLPAVIDVLEALSRPESRILRRVPSPTGEADREGYELFHDVLSGAVRDWRQRTLAAAMLERRMRLVLLPLVAIAATAVALIAALLNPTPLKRLELRTADARFAIRKQQSPDSGIALVAIDARTLQRRGRGAGASRILPREQQARLVDAVARGRPARIVEDIEYEGNADPSGTAALQRALGQARAGVVLATTRIDDSGQTTLFGKRGGWASRAAYAGATPDLDGTIRRIRPNVRQPGGYAAMPTLAVKGARSSLDPSRFPRQGAWIDFSGGAGTYRPISADDVLAGKVPASRFAGKIVVIGATAAVKGDRQRTPAEGGSTLSGPEIQANAIATVRRGLPLKEVGRGIEVLLILALAAVPAALALMVSLRTVLLLSAAAGALFLVAAQLAFDAGHIVPVIPPLLALILSMVGVVVVDRLHVRAGQRRPRRPRISSSSVADDVAAAAPAEMAQSR
jgi:CHASE2 domain-containing sensor protein